MRQLDPIEMLAEAIHTTTSNDAADSLLHAIYYLRAGKFPFNRTKR